MTISDKNFVPFYHLVAKVGHKIISNLKIKSTKQTNKQKTGNSQKVSKKVTIFHLRTHQLMH
jgi:hypothetical protein